MKEKESRGGSEAENFAAEYMLRQGYTLRERNWRPKGSSGSKLELDIVCQKLDMIVFVEVKARKPDTGDPVDAVDEAKIRRICRAADIYLRMQEYDYSFRFDIISIVGTDRSNFVLEHIEDAFLPPLTAYR